MHSRSPRPLILTLMPIQALYRAKLLGRNRVEVQPVCEPGSLLEDPTAPAQCMELQHTAG